MNGVEDLLRQSLQEMPAATTIRDPLAELDRRIRRARRRLAVGGGVAAAAVIAAVVVPLTLVNSGDRAGIQIGGHPTSLTRVQLDSTAYGVATNDDRGHSFVVIDRGDGAGRAVVELAGNGDRIRSRAVPDSALFVAQRGGMVWVWGGGDGAFPDTQVTALGPGPTAGATLSLGRGQAVRSLAVTKGGNAWAVTVDQVVHLRYRDGAVHVVERIPVTGAQRIVTSLEGTLWVQAGTRLVELLPNGDGQDTSYADPQSLSHHWAGDLLAAGMRDSFGSADRLWMASGSRQVVLLDPLTVDQGANLAPDAYVGVPVNLPDRPTALAEDGIGGIYVALAGGGVVFYDFGAVPKGGPPTARLARDAVDVETMAVSSDGSLLMQDFGGKLLRWSPEPR